MWKVSQPDDQEFHIFSQINGRVCIFIQLFQNEFILTSEWKAHENTARCRYIDREDYRRSKMFSLQYSDRKFIKKSKSFIYMYHTFFFIYLIIVCHTYWPWCRARSNNLATSGFNRSYGFSQKKNMTECMYNLYGFLYMTE